MKIEGKTQKPSKETYDYNTRHHFQLPDVSTIPPDYMHKRYQK